MLQKLIEMFYRGMVSVPLPRKRVAGAPGPSPDPSRDPSRREACAGSTSPLFGVDGPARAIDHGPSRDRDASSELSACACNNRAIAAADDHLDCERAAMDDASSPPDSRPRAHARLFGDRFGDRYELLQSIGAGAFGQVYLARRREDDVRVAVKKVELAGMDRGRVRRHAQRGGDPAPSLPPQCHPLS